MAYTGVVSIGSGDGSGGSLTSNTTEGVIDCGTLTNLAVTAFQVVLTNNKVISAATPVSLTVQYAGAIVTAGIPIAYISAQAAGSVTIQVLNIGLINALNGAVKIHFRVG